MLKTIIDPVARCVVRVITDNDPNPGQFLLYYRTRVNSTLSGFRLKAPPIWQQHGLELRILSSAPVDTASGAEPAEGCRLNHKTETGTPGTDTPMVLTGWPWLDYHAQRYTAGGTGHRLDRSDADFGQFFARPL